MKWKVLIAEPDGFTDEAVDVLRRVADVDRKAIRAEELAWAFDTYDVIWLRLGHRIDAALVEGAQRCRFIANAVTGLDHIDLDACAKKGIEVLSLRGERAFLREVRATAELAVALALALPRHLNAAVASVHQGHWRRDDFRGHELYRKTAGIVGVGRLGAIVGDYFAALGMDVIGYDVSPFTSDVIEPVADLEALLRRSDVVSLHVALTEDTKHLIGAAELRLMKPTATLVNTARGAVVDGEALLAALRDGEIAGAALDVVEGEPDLGAEHPLISYARNQRNLIITPHIGGNTYESFIKTEVFIAEKVVTALEAQS